MSHRLLTAFLAVTVTLAIAGAGTAAAGVPSAPARGSSSGVLHTSRYTVDYTLTGPVNAYQPATIHYRVRANGPSRLGAARDVPLYLQATAFEDPAREHSGQVFTQDLPGRVSAHMSYLGETEVSTGADIDGNLLDRTVHRHSGHATIWRYLFFRVTNTGNTVLTADGLSRTEILLNTYWESPTVAGINPWPPGTQIGSPTEQEQPLADDLYPGESTLVTVADPYIGGIPGNYKLELQLKTFRDTYEPYTQILTATEYSRLDLPFTVVAAGGALPPEPPPGSDVVTNDGMARTPPKGLENDNEFLNAYTSVSGPDGHGTLQVQLPPWPATITLRALGPGTGDMSLARIPVVPGTRAPSAQLGRWNQDGGRLTSTWKVATSQGMRPFVSTWYYPYREMQFAPDPLAKITQDLTAMQHDGITVVYLQVFSQFVTDTGPQGESVRWALQEAGRLGLKIIPSFDFFRLGSMGTATGTPFTQADWSSEQPGYNYDIASPNFPAAASRWFDKAFNAYSPLFFHTTDGKVPVFMSEDQMGAWHYYYGRARFRYHTANDVAAWHAYLTGKYAGIGALNSAWNTSYASFGAVPTPTEKCTDLPNDCSDGPRIAPFAEWTTPLNDWDHFLSDLFARTYHKIADLDRAEHPNSLLGLHIEGGQFTAWNDTRQAGNPWSLLAADGIDWGSARQGTFGSDIIGGKAGLDMFGGANHFPLDYAREDRYDLAHGVVPVLYPLNDTEYFFPGCGNGGTYTDLPGHIACSYANLPRASGQLTTGYVATRFESIMSLIQPQYQTAGVAGFYSWNDYALNTHVSKTTQRELRYIAGLETAAWGTSPHPAASAQLPAPPASSAAPDVPTLSGMPDSYLARCADGRSMLLATPGDSIENPCYGHGGVNDVRRITGMWTGR